MPKINPKDWDDEHEQRRRDKRHKKRKQQQENKEANEPLLERLNPFK